MALKALAEPGRDMGRPAQRDRPVGRPQRHRQHPFDPGMPYGTYDICVQDTRPSPDQYQTFTYDNTSPADRPRRSTTPARGPTARAPHEPPSRTGRHVTAGAPVALSIAMIVSLAIFALVETVMRRAGDVGARVESTQRARIAMDFITRQLRSQVCVLSTSPATVDPRAVVTGTPTSVTFFSDLGDESHRTGNTIKAPELRSLSFESGKLIERVWVGVQGGTAFNPTYSYANYPAHAHAERASSPTTSRPPRRPRGGQPLVFRYFEFNTATPPKPEAEIDSRERGRRPPRLPSSRRIDVAFQANRTRGKATDRGSTQLENTIYVRTADPNSTTPRPVCA